jgi:hypothetical protein
MANIPVPDNPDFSTDMTALETSTPAYAPTFNNMFQQLLANDKNLKNSEGKITDDSTGKVYKIGVENGLVYIDDGKTDDNEN